RRHLVFLVPNKLLISCPPVDLWGSRNPARCCYKRRDATNDDSSRRRSARPPNGASARLAVSQSSPASWPAPPTPLNDPNGVLRASARTAFPVSAVLPVTSSRSSTIWNASLRFLAYAASAASGSAAAPAVSAPHMAPATNNAPVLPR